MRVVKSGHMRKGVVEVVYFKYSDTFDYLVSVTLKNGKEARLHIYSWESIKADQEVNEVCETK